MAAISLQQLVCFIYLTTPRECNPFAFSSSKISFPRLNICRLSSVLNIKVEDVFRCLGDCVNSSLLIYTRTHGQCPLTQSLMVLPLIGSSLLFLLSGGLRKRSLTLVQNNFSGPSIEEARHRSLSHNVYKIIVLKT